LRDNQQETVRSRPLVIVQPLECHYLVILTKINKQFLPVSKELCTMLNAMRMEDPTGKMLSVQHSTLLFSCADIKEMSCCHHWDSAFDKGDLGQTYINGGWCCQSNILEPFLFKKVLGCTNCLNRAEPPQPGRAAPQARINNSSSQFHLHSDCQLGSERQVRYYVIAH
jgi:hypothetical protein